MLSDRDLQKLALAQDIVSPFNWVFVGILTIVLLAINGVFVFYVDLD